MSEATYFRKQASECKQLASDTADRREREALLGLAKHYEREVARVELRPHMRSHS